MDVPSSTQIFQMVLEKEFRKFNNMHTTMCKYKNCKKIDCNFAHWTTTMKKPICIYHFSKGCYKSEQECKYSHNFEEAVNTFRSYEHWKFCMDFKYNRKVTEQNTNFSCSAD